MPLRITLPAPHSSDRTTVSEFDSAAALFTAIDDDRVWAHIPGGMPDSPAALETRLIRSDRQPHLIRLDGTVVGTSSYLFDPAPPEGVEIGATLLAPRVWGGGVNTEAKRIMLAAAFDAGARWVQFRTDERNSRSAAAILKLGAVEQEPRREPSIVRADGTVRTSRMFRLLAS